MTDSNNNENFNDFKCIKQYTINGQPIEFYWHKYLPPFYYGRSEVSTKSLLEKCAKYFHEAINVDKDPSDNTSDIGFWAAFTYPKCKDPWRMEVLTKFFLFQFWLDDQSQNFWGDVKRDSNKAIQIYGQLIEVLDKLLGVENISMIEWKPYIVGHYNCLDSIFMNYSPNQRKQLADAIKQFCLGNIEECKITDGSIIMKDVEHWFWQRIRNVGVIHCAQLVEFALGFELTQKEWESSVLQNLIELAGKSILFVNDLFSFRKEIIECNGDLRYCSNSIILFIVTENLLLQDSVDKLFKELDKTDKAFLAIEKKLKLEKTLSNNMIKFIDGLKALIGGNWLFQLGLKRYHGKNFTGIVPLSGKFIFSEEGTIIIPDKLIEKENDLLKKFYE